MELEKRLESLKKRFLREDFLKNKGLANEIPFYIFDYNPKKELIVRNFVKNDLVKKFADSELVNLCVIDLFEMMIERLKKEDIFERSFGLEEKRGSKKLFEALGKSMNSDILEEEIKRKSEGKNVVCLIGVGKVYPIIEPNELLENLQKVFDFTKLVLFLPGKYTRQKIVVLDEFSSKPYYRAIRLTGEY